MKRVLVLGATGGIGRKLLELGVTRGLEITALVRTPDKIARQSNVRVMGGDPLDPRVVAEAAGGQDAVVSALGAPSTGPTSVHTDAARSLVAALEGRSSPRRVVMVSAAMLFPDAGVLAALLRSTVLRHIASDSREAEQVLTRSALDWTIVRPPRLTHGPLTGRWCVAQGRLPENGSRSISRADVAECLLDEALRQAPSQRLLGVACS